MPVTLTTDFVSFKANQTLQTPGFGVNIFKIALVVAAGGASSAGTVVITEPNSGIALYPTMPVAVSTPANTIIFTDNLASRQLQWRDFSVTGLTATGTVLYLWYRL